MPQVTYRANPDGIRQLGRGPAMLSAMVNIAREGAAFAESISPHATGEYASSFVVEPAVVTAGRDHEQRAGARIVNTSPHAAGVEYGGINQRGEHILRRTASAVDGRKRVAKPSGLRPRKPSGAGGS